MTSDPGIAIERQSRKSDRDKVAVFFKAHHGEEITSEALDALIGPNFQQRISECRRDLGMRIVCLPQWLYGESFDSPKSKPRLVKIKRLEGHYLYTDHEPLGPDAASERSEKHPPIPQTLFDVGPR